MGRLGNLDIEDIAALDTPAKLKSAIGSAPFIPSTGVWRMTPVMKFTPSCIDCQKTIQTLLFDWYIEGVDLKLYDDGGAGDSRLGVIFASDKRLQGEELDNDD